MFRLLRFLPGNAILHRTRLRAVIRGYRILKASSRLGVIGEIKNALTELPISECKGKFNPSILGAAAEFAELALRQYLLIQLGSIGFNRVLLMSVANPRGSIAYPMPGHWRRVVRQHGFRVSEWRCAFYWTVYVFGMLGYGSLRALRILIDGIRTGYTRKLAGECCAYFFDLSSSCLPLNHTDDHPSHEIITWYAKWSGRNPAITTIRHGVQGVAQLSVEGMRVESQKTPLPPLSGSREILQFLYWSVGAIVQSACDVLRGRWWHAVMLSHAAVAAQVRQVPEEALAKHYLFHNSGWIYRPLWTYEAEKKGAAIIFYFYSTNCEGFKRADGYPPISDGWKAMNWPRYLVWDQYQADFVRRAVGGGANIQEVGEIWFQDDSGAEIPQRSRAVAVFDVQPKRESVYRALCLDFDYYTAATAVQFLHDIQTVLNDNNYAVLHKRKRNIGKSVHPRYRRSVKNLEAASNYVSVPPEVAASRVVAQCVAVISMPYTSTAILGRSFGIPSVYYDPLGCLVKDDRGAHGIPLLSGIAELREWVRSLASSKDFEMQVSSE